jgi:hypothetical protein
MNGVTGIPTRVSRTNDVEKGIHLRKHCIVVKIVHFMQIYKLLYCIRRRRKLLLHNGKNFGTEISVEILVIRGVIHVVTTEINNTIMKQE